MKHEESKIQQTCVRYFRYQYPKCLIYANANGGKRPKIEAGIMQSEGVTAGIPDLTILTSDSMHGIELPICFFIEMKSETGKLTEKQAEMQKRITEMGFSVYVCRSLDEFIEICKKEIG